MSRHSRLKRLRAAGWCAVGIAVATASSPVAAELQAEEGLRISAKVDKTDLELGKQFTLVITIEGDLSTAELKSFEFPKPIQTLAQSRSSNIALEGGRMKRSVSLEYLLVAREAGTFQLGPFEIVRQGHTYQTDPIDIVVKKPVLPPTLGPDQRLIL